MDNFSFMFIDQTVKAIKNIPDTLCKKNLKLHNKNYFVKQSFSTKQYAKNIKKLKNIRDNKILVTVQAALFPISHHPTNEY